MNETINFDEFNIYILRRQVKTFIFIIIGNLSFFISFLMGIKDLENKDSGTTVKIFGLSAEQVALVASTIGTITAYILSQTAEMNYQEKVVQLAIEHPEYTTKFIRNLNLLTSANFMVSFIFLINVYEDYQQRHQNIFFF